MVPLFSMLFLWQGIAGPGEIMHLALGTSMATIIFTSFASIRAHYRKQNVQTDMAARISLGVLAATFVASYAKGSYLVNGWGHTDLPHYILGFVYLPAVATVALGSALTAPLGIRYATTLPVGTLKKTFGLLAVVLSIKMLTTVF